MPKYRNALPQDEDNVMLLTDGGLETSLIYRDGIDLPHFAACELLRTENGMRRLLDYYNENALVAVKAGIGFSIDSPTWRANPDWADKLGYTSAEFDEINRAGIHLAEEVRRRNENDASPMVIAGLIGPRGDGYRVGDKQTPEAAAEYHSRQIALFADTEADYIAALTLSYSAEAIGIARAAHDLGMPVVISFTVELDGRLASGESLGNAIETVDAATRAYPDYYMVNCAHPDHLPDELLDVEAAWPMRVRGIRANASRKSHEELDESTELDDGDPDELGREFGELRDRLPHLTVVGGCCGTDVRHIEAIARAVAR